MPAVQPCAPGAMGVPCAPGGTQPVHKEGGQTRGLAHAAPPPVLRQHRLRACVCSDTPDHRFTALAAFKDARIAPQRAGRFLTSIPSGLLRMRRVGGAWTATSQNFRTDPVLWFCSEEGPPGCPPSPLLWIGRPFLGRLPPTRHGRHGATQRFAGASLADGPEREGHA